MVTFWAFLITRLPAFPPPEETETFAPASNITSYPAPGLKVRTPLPATPDASITIFESAPSIATDSPVFANT